MINFYFFFCKNSPILCTCSQFVQTQDKCACYTVIVSRIQAGLSHDFYRRLSYEQPYASLYWLRRPGAELHHDRLRHHPDHPCRPDRGEPLLNSWNRPSIDISPNTEYDSFVNYKSYLSSLNGEIVIDDSITKIGRGAFSGCKSLTNIILPNEKTPVKIIFFANKKHIKAP